MIIFWSISTKEKYILNYTELNVGKHKDIHALILWSIEQKYRKVQIQNRIYKILALLNNSCAETRQKLLNFPTITFSMQHSTRVSVQSQSLTA